MTFDEFRLQYHSLTDEEMRAVYSAWYALYPTQRHCTLDALVRFLDCYPRMPVLEIGGWDGFTAGYCLTARADIPEWLNVEICAEAAGVPCGQSRQVSDPYTPGSAADCYFAATPTAFRWWRGDKYRLRKNHLIVASHVLEHLSDADCRELVGMLKPVAWYVEMPLTDGGQTWEGYHGSHVLRAGWNEFDAWMHDAGYLLLRREGDCAHYQRS